MNTVDEYVSGLTNEDRHNIIASYEQFSKDGFIGESPVREHATKLCEILSCGDGHVVFWMEKLTMSCYKYYYHNSCQNGCT